MKRGCGHPCKCLSYREHCLSIAFGAAAMPTRRGDVADTESRERLLRKNLDAYTRLRRDGLQPPSYEGCAELEAKATEEHQITAGAVD